MSSINFTGLESIKIGDADCTVYFQGNIIWPLDDDIGVDTGA
jgi:hypothetical protein